MLLSLHSRLFCLFILLNLVTTSCTLIKPKEKNNETSVMLKTALKNPAPELAGDVLSTASGNWFYGQGVGQTALNVGTTIMFPPYAAVILGNFALDLMGYESVGLSNFLDKEDKVKWVNFYDGVTSVPGQMTSKVAGEEFRTQEVAKKKFKTILTKQRDEKILNSSYAQAEQQYWYK
jgi:hypothetical protein